MLLITLMLACDPTGGQDSAPQDSDTAQEGLSQDELDGLKSWENMPVKIEFIVKTGRDESESVVGDTVVVFVPLESAQLPELGFLWDVIQDSDDQASAKAINHDASRSNNTNSVIDGGSDLGDGRVSIIKAATISWDDGEPCMGTVEECMSQAALAELKLSQIDPSALDFDLSFGHTFKSTEPHNGTLSIGEPIDESTPLQLDGSSLDGWVVSGQALARFQIFDGDKLVATHGPYQDWEELLQTLGDLPTANHVSGLLVDGGMLLTLAWDGHGDDGGGEHQVSWGTNFRNAWEQPTDTERYWMDQRVAQGGAFGPDLKNLEFGWLGFSPSTEAGEVTISSTLSASYGAHVRAVPVALDIGADREGGWEELEVSLNGLDCTGPCASTSQRGEDIILRKRSNNTRLSTGWGVESAGGAGAGVARGQVIYGQNGNTMTLDYQEASTTVVFESESGECRVCLGEQDSINCQNILLECGKSFEIEADLPVAFESTFEGKEYHSGLTF